MQGLIAIALVIMLMASGSALSDTHCVEKWGSSIAACSKSSPCLTIQHAVNLSRKDDRIVVGPGIYREKVVMRVSLVHAEALSGLKLESTAARYGIIIKAVASSDPDLCRNVRIGRKGK